jgi:hypothetical protein
MALLSVMLAHGLPSDIEKFVALGVLRSNRLMAHIFPAAPGSRILRTM